MKKRYTILFVFLILCAHSAWSQTNVSGFINANTTWTLAGSPYIVTGNALLSQGFTLTIDPGVIVKFDSNKALQIDGQLIAVGTPSQRIIFTSNQSSPQPGDWAKLHFSDFSVDAVYDAAGNYVSGTIMKCCDVLYAGSLMWGSIDIQQCSPYFNHCRITDGSWCGINFNGERLTVDSTVIRNFPKRGIYYMGGYFLFRNDTFVSNLEGAIHLLQNYDSIQSRIVNSYFRWNYGALSWQNNGVNNTTIKNNTFVYNNGPAVLSLQGTNDTISCNTFRYNTNGPAIHWNDNFNPWGGGVIHNNMIEYNSNPSGPSVFHIGAGQMTDTMYISNNTVRHNSSPGNSCCQFDLYFTGATRYLQIYNNIFTENDGNNFMMLWGPQTNDPSFDFMFLNNNTFINPLCTYELYNYIPYGSPNLQVANNYWGSTSTPYVDGVIYDYFDFANQSVVYYMPILLAPVAVDTTCQPFQLPVGVEQQNLVSVYYVKVFPNPATSEFVVDFPLFPRGDKVFVMYNSIGEEVKRVVVTKPEERISCVEFVAGIYFYSILSEGELIGSGKFIKE